MLSPTTHREGLLRVGSLPCLCTYLQPWRGTARGLRSFRTCTTTRMQLEGRNVPYKQYSLFKRPPTSNLYRGRNWCTTHVAKATDVFSEHDCIFNVEQPLERVPTDRYLLFSACSVDMLPPRPSPLRYSHPGLSPTYTRSVFEDRFEFLRPSVRGTPSPTTQSEGLLLRVGTLPCAPTYNRGVVQHVIFNRFGLAQPHECSSKAATCHANSTVQAASNGI